MAPRPFGKYLLLDKIADGGMAEVFKALYRTEGEFEKTLVIKRILPGMSRDEEFVARFRDEAKLSVALSHANIVQVFDYGNVEGDFFLAMELVEGQNLRGLLVRCKELDRTLPAPAALLIAAESAKALSYAHAKKDERGRELGIVHRDISPSNILVSYEGDVKITDFGIAKATSRSTHTQDGSVRGKVRYMAPEQALGGDVDGRADVFSLGCVLWECLTGRLLFDADSDMAVLGQLVRGAALPKPSSVAPGIAPDIERVVMAALAPEAATRVTAAELHRELAKLLSKAGGYSSLDLAAFMQELFRPEIERRNEVLRMTPSSPVRAGRDPISTSAVPLPEPAAPGTRNLPSSPGTRTPPPRRRWPVIVAGIAVAAILAAGAGLRFGFPGAPVGATPTPIAAASPSPSASATPVASATPAAVALVTPATIATPAPTPERAATPKPTPAGTGIVALISAPDGEIWVDGKATGRETPAFNLKVPAGRRKIRIVKGNLEKTLVVDVVANQTTRVPKVTLEPR